MDVDGLTFINQNFVRGGIVWMEDNPGKSGVGRDRGVVLQLESSDFKDH
jgi:hypothetical protein